MEVQHATEKNLIGREGRNQSCIFVTLHCKCQLGKNKSFSSTALLGRQKTLKSHKYRKRSKAYTDTH